MRCEQVVDDLADLAAGHAEAVAPDHVAHVEHCLRCQAEMVQYRKLLRALRTLRTEVLEPSPGLLADVLAGIEEEAERHAIAGLLRGRRAAYLGGLAAATAAAGGAIVLANHARRRVKLAG